MNPPDLAALRRARHAAAAGEADCLARFPLATAAELRRRRGPRGAPFTL